MITKTPRNNEGLFDLNITDRNNQSFTMTVGENGDLYWIPANHKINRVFEIEKNDEITFSVFSQLFDAIKKVDDKYNPTLAGESFRFISEDWHEDEANNLSITKFEDMFHIEFIQNTNKDAWSYPHRGCNICFCNSGSRVPKVESLFMRMFTFLAYECELIQCIPNDIQKEM